jgi:hypothetical protein
MTKGARVMLSTPPAITTSRSPVAMARRVLERLEPGAAEAVDGDARDLVGQPREQRAMRRDVAVVLAGLVGGAEDHLVDGRAHGGRDAVAQRADGVARRGRRGARRRGRRGNFPMGVRTASTT